MYGQGLRPEPYFSAGSVLSYRRCPRSLRTKFVLCPQRHTEFVPCGGGNSRILTTLIRDINFLVPSTEDIPNSFLPVPTRDPKSRLGSAFRTIVKEDLL